ncbi:MAG: hypothetical protein AVDCRST_MAG93-4230 [uncultured Chloroflexia bacterium]|uniref:Uncharacterized protein n=1 Tax=uncultured Chloroflexia bacterium TaxID=1672391 RepID=A0A6J4K4A7_9CHLR|nr:MAG: hypothetical protein AVDCRST_MAG93-4230 [uncultured Chloroflexia bacterium]
MPDKAAWSSIPEGTIIDSDMVALAEGGHLITDGFSREGIRQACYELTASKIWYETSAEREDKRVEVGDNGYVLRPNSYVTAIVSESIELPDNVLARILTKGRLFSVGILPVCTYADPGFSGRLGITMVNASHRYIVIKPGEPIAKIEFSVLGREVERPYSGQHGYDAEIWPIPFQLYAKADDLDASGIDPKDLDEIRASYGPVVRSLEARVRFYEKRVWI